MTGYCNPPIETRFKKGHESVSGGRPKNSKNWSTIVNKELNELITIKEVNKYIKNLTFVRNFEWEKNFDKISEINFDKYKNISDLEYTINQQVLMYNFQKAEEVFKQKQMEDRERYIKANQRIKIGNLDLEKIPQEFKLGIFLIIFLIFFGTIFYYLKGLNKKLGANSKKKKKKTQ